MRFSALILSSITLVSLAFSATAATPPATNRTEVEGIIKDYLSKNPEVVVDALNAYQDKKLKEAQAKSKDAIIERKSDIFEDPAAPKVGAKDADVVIAEFFDYHCGYCKHMLPVVTQLLAEDKKVRVVFREFPILSEDSELAARAGLAVYKINPDKYFAFHTELMKTQGKFDQTKLTAEAKKLGISEAKLKEAMNSDEVSAEIKKNRELAQALAINGTPAFVIGGDIMPGAVSIDDLKASIAKARGATTPAK